MYYLKNIKDLVIKSKILYLYSSAIAFVFEAITHLFFVVYQLLWALTKLLLFNSTAKFKNAGDVNFGPYAVRRPSPATRGLTKFHRCPICAREDRKMFNMYKHLVEEHECIPLSPEAVKQVQSHIQRRKLVRISL